MTTSGDPSTTDANSSQNRVELLTGTALADTIERVRTSPRSSALWADLERHGYSPQLDVAHGAHVVFSDSGESFSQVSIPFTTAEHETARLVWDNVRGQERTAYGLHRRSGERLNEIRIHEPVDGQVEHTLSLVRQANNDLDLVDARGHHVQTIPAHKLADLPGTGSTATRLTVDAGACDFCGRVVDILLGVVACSIWGYFVCDASCTGLTAGNLALCSIVCGIVVALVCYVAGEIIKAMACQPWCS